jgi:long-subunit fatty acid transport protein
MDPNSDGSYSPRVINDDFRQRQEMNMDGALYEYIFTLGGNYDDKLFLGATLGIPYYNYSEKTNYTETRESFYDTLGYDLLECYDAFKSNATGINLKLGVIYQPAKFVRVGLAFHTQNWYPNVRKSYLNDRYKIKNIYQPLDSSYYNEPSEITEGEFNYQLITPYRAMANIAFIINKYGFINLDYEFTDYSTSAMLSNSYSFAEENSATKKYFRDAHTVRIGGELNLSPIAFRLGYSFSSNPYKKEANIDGTRHTISGGIGFKGKTFFADFAYMYRFTNDKDVFYDAESSIYPYSSQIVSQVFALTLGLKL